MLDLWVYLLVTEGLSIVYDQKVLSEVITNITSDSRFVCIVSFGGTADDSSVPLLSHLTKDSTRYNASESHINVVNHAYNTTSPLFVHPDSTDYHGPSAALAHTRSLVFLRKHLGGPHFDLEKIWNEHCFYEFEVRSVTKTMSTMVVSYGFGYEMLFLTYLDIGRTIR
jgi:carboxymethylenebutenolidase